MEPIRQNGELTNIVLLPLKKGDSLVLGGTPDELVFAQNAEKNYVQYFWDAFAMGPVLRRVMHQMHAMAEEGRKRKGIDIKVLMEMVQSGELEPEMLGRVLAKLVKEAAASQEFLD